MQIAQLPAMLCIMTDSILSSEPTLEERKLVFKRSMQRPKITNAVMAAKEKMDKALADPEILEMINHRLQEISLHQNLSGNKNLNGAEQPLFYLTNDGISKFRSRELDPLVTGYTDDFSIDISTYYFVEDTPVPVRTHPDMVDVFSSIELEKIYLHEFAHLLFSTTDMPLKFSISSWDNPSDIKNYLHTLELCCDAVSDIIEAYPAMGDVICRLNVIQSKENADDCLTHPSGNTRGDSSIDTNRQLAQRRYDQFYSCRL